MIEQNARRAGPQRAPDIGMASTSDRTESESELEVSVVIATRNRGAMVRDCITAIVAGDPSATFEVVIVDDSEDGSLQDFWRDDPRVRLLQTNGIGTGPARNAGVASARGRWILFTDDDTLPEPGWVDATANAFRRNTDLRGLEGPIRTLPWDPLYEHSILATTPGHCWGANVAYPRAELLALGGFWHRYREDRELAIRVKHHGTVGWEERMAVVHRPRRRDLADFAVKRARVHADLVLHAIELRPGRRWIRLRLLLWTVRFWRSYRPPLSNPRRLARWLAITALQTSSSAAHMIVVPEWVKTEIRAHEFPAPLAVETSPRRPTDPGSGS